MLRQLKDNKGFTIIELFMVLAVLSILAQMTLTFVLDLKTRSSDVVAISDGRNLMTIVSDNFVNLEDVDYEQTNGADVGVKTVGGAPRQPVFTLSSGVQIRFEGVNVNFSNGIPGEGWLEAYLYHINGTSDSSSTSGKREFYYCADESSGSYTLATF